MTNLQTPYTPLKESEAAVLLGCARNTLRKSRMTGLLFGKPTPAYEKRGRSVFYQLTDIETFNSQFKKFANTAEHEQAA